ncbi:MAG: DNA gyrase inhibitor YacG [Devosiaceae bacterium]|nr:DNA gyrase inhibitor YacG [Devosiaceae bacterium]
MDAPKPTKVGPGKSALTRLRPTKPCPICQNPSTQKFYPFCTVRCANIDLNRWLTGAYAVPVPDEEEQGPQDEFASE